MTAGRASAGRGCEADAAPSVTSAAPGAPAAAVRGRARPAAAAAPVARKERRETDIEPPSMAGWVAAIIPLPRGGRRGGGCAAHRVTAMRRFPDIAQPNP